MTAIPCSSCGIPTCAVIVISGGGSESSICRRCAWSPTAIIRRAVPVTRPVRPASPASAAQLAIPEVKR